MKKILLCDAFNAFCAFGKSFGIKLCHNSSDPDINGEGVNSAATVNITGGNFYSGDSYAAIDVANANAKVTISGTA